MPGGGSLPAVAVEPIIGEAVAERKDILADAGASAVEALAGHPHVAKIGGRREVCVCLHVGGAGSEDQELGNALGRRPGQELPCQGAPPALDHRRPQLQNGQAGGGRRLVELGCRGQLQRANLPSARGTFPGRGHGHGQQVAAVDDGRPAQLEGRHQGIDGELPEVSQTANAGHHEGVATEADRALCWRHPHRLLECGPTRDSSCLQNAASWAEMA
mmetsp:Transcript_58964/g.175421  ORF Transcript_58964/g.175421 Transcript_58964/m.175421 type:complete len:216 (+) Transcript_58964:355-1002(+)